MALHPHFPADPYAPLLPNERWFPAAEELRDTAYEKLLPPLVAKIREEVKAWRDAGYKGATGTSQALLTWWFDTEHLIEQADGNLSPSLEDDLRNYFLSPFGPKPVGKTTDSKTDLGEIVREIEELAVFNDEALIAAFSEFQTAR